jgi:hypothetical protein
MGGADLVAGEPEIEVENVPNLVTDEGYKVARKGIGLGGRGWILRSNIHTFHALHI